MNNWRKWLGPLVGILLSVLFLGLALYNVKLNDVAAALTTADYRLVLLAGVFTFCSYIFRTARWARFLQPQKRIPIPRLFPVLVIGFALNNLLPARPGEIARAISLGQREGLSKTLGLATVIVERVADGLTLIAILVALSLAFDLPGWGQQAELVSTVIFIVALA
ncbi:MAG: lysylphosphatidylglycerol synthase transmembrane domain-containing protein, partial [Anaerolineae bacterium]